MYKEKRGKKNIKKNGRRLGERHFIFAPVLTISAITFNFFQRHVELREAISFVNVFPLNYCNYVYFAGILTASKSSAR